MLFGASTHALKNDQWMCSSLAADRPPYANTHLRSYLFSSKDWRSQNIPSCFATGATVSEDRAAFPKARSNGLSQVTTSFFPVVTGSY